MELKKKTSGIPQQFKPNLNQSQYNQFGANIAEIEHSSPEKSVYFTDEVKIRIDNVCTPFLLAIASLG